MQRPLPGDVAQRALEPERPALEPERPALAAARAAVSSARMQCVPPADTS